MLAPLPFLQFAAKGFDLGSVRCDALKFVQHMYSIGYHFVDPQASSPRPISLYSILEGVKLDSFYLRPKSVPRPPSWYHPTNDFWFVHEDAMRQGWLPPGWGGLEGQEIK